MIDPLIIDWLWILIQSLIHMLLFVIYTMSIFSLIWIFYVCIHQYLSIPPHTVQVIYDHRWVWHFGHTLFQSFSEVPTQPSHWTITILALPLRLLSGQSKRAACWKVQAALLHAQKRIPALNRRNESQMPKV